MPIVNRHIADNAEINSLKIDFAVTADPTVDADSSALTEGRIVWNATDDALKVYDGSSFISIAQASANTGSLDDALQLGPKGLRPLEIEYSDASAKCMVLDQNGNGGCLTLENAGTGTDITGSAFDISKAGVLTATGLTMIDAKVITLGTGSDFTLQCDSSNNLLLDGAAADTVIKVGASNNQDFIIYGATATDFVQFDTDDSAKQAIFEDFHILMMDDTDIRIGDGADVVIDWDTSGTDYLLINPAADDTLISFGKSAATQLSCDVRMYGNGANGTEYIYFDASESELYTVGCDIWIKDDDYLEFGNASDVTLTWASGGGLTMAAAADNSVFTVGDGTQSFDLKWFGGSANDFVAFGADTATVGTWDFGQDNYGIDVRFYGATSGARLHWDESADMLVGLGGAQISLNDSVELLMGTGASNAGDFKIYGSSTPTLIINSVVAETGTVEIGADNLGLDVTIFSATASAGFIFDASGDALRALAGSHVNLVDDGELRFGTGASANAGDLKLSSNSSNVLQLEQVVSTVGTFEIGVDNVGIDVKFYAEATGAYMLWDEDGNTDGELVFEGADVHMKDDDQIAFGDARDAVLDWDTVIGTDGLVLDCAVDDSVFILGDGTTCWDLKWYAGAAGVYMEWDASAAILNIGLDDNGIDAKFFGDTASFYQMWDASGDEWLCSAGATPSYIRLAVSTLAQHDAISATGTEGQICYMSNGAGGAACLAFSDGANWLRADTLAACAAA